MALWASLSAIITAMGMAGRRHQAALMALTPLVLCLVMACAPTVSGSGAGRAVASAVRSSPGFPADSRPRPLPSPNSQPASDTRRSTAFTDSLRPASGQRNRAGLIASDRQDSLARKIFLC